MPRETPVSLACVIGEPPNGFPHVWDVIVTSGLEQQYVNVRIFSESSRHNGTRRARPTNDEIVLLHERSTKSTLIQTGSRRELGLVIVQWSAVYFFSHV